MNFYSCIYLYILIFGTKTCENLAKVIIIFLSKDPVLLNVEENAEVVLNFSKPGSGGPYEDITWYKYQTGNSQYRIVFVHPSATTGESWYYNEFCSGSSPCETSRKGELNVVTGKLTIYNVNISDEGFYYYDFYIEGGAPNTGHKYEIELEVNGKSMRTLRNFKISVVI